MECGTLNIVGVAGLRAGLSWILEKGIDRIHEQEMRLYRKLCDGLRRIEKVTLYCAGGVGDSIAVLSFNIDGWEAADVGTILDVDYNIACRTGLQCAPLVHAQLGTDRIHGAVRLSIGPFNTEEHIDRAIKAVKDIAAVERDRTTLSQAQSDSV
jgi:selenocysteine lyase/cysteine desulfurase